MPKQVDHQQRRAEMAEALWRVAAFHGLEAVSISRVAEEAGVSKGRVQHYFPSRDALLDYTASRVQDRVTRRIEAVLSQAPGPMEAVRAALLEVLPLEPGSIVDTRVGFAFFIRSLSDPVLRERYRRRNHEFIDLITHYLAQARNDTALGSAEQPSEAASALFALVNGLKEPLLLGDLSASEATAMVNHALEVLQRRSAGE